MIPCSNYIPYLHSKSWIGQWIFRFEKHVTLVYISHRRISLLCWTEKKLQDKANVATKRNNLFGKLLSSHPWTDKKKIVAVVCLVAIMLKKLGERHFFLQGMCGGTYLLALSRWSYFKWFQQSVRGQMFMTTNGGRIRLS